MKFKPAPRDLKSHVLKYLDSQEFIYYMQSKGEIKTPGSSYGETVSDLCNNAVGFCFLKLRDTLAVHSCEAVVGTFGGKDHAWLKFGEYYIDMTLAQFIEAPEIVTINETDAAKLGYRPHTIYEAGVEGLMQFLGDRT